MLALWYPVSYMTFYAEKATHEHSSKRKLRRLGHRCKRTPTGLTFSNLTTLLPGRPLNRYIQYVPRTDTMSELS